MTVEKITKNVYYKLGVKTLLLEVRDDEGHFQDCELFQIAYEKLRLRHFFGAERKVWIKKM